MATVTRALSAKMALLPADLRRTPTWHRGMELAATLAAVAAAASRGRDDIGGEVAVSVA